ncbi:MAG TPA: type II toxin-antitoxin system VapB family antitoxin [Thermoanaerobaculia bacterium]|nr:type II toxin-antitoxin system VapB family antitoxin [Thermoanaerobaculia bacterium]
MCMRTNIVLDERLVAEAMRLSKAKTKKGLVEEALRTLVAVRSREEKARRYERGFQRLRKRLDGIGSGESAVDILRQDRERS